MSCSIMKKEIKDKQINDWIWGIKTHIDALDNKNRREILRLCYKKPRTISELKRILKSSNKVTWHNVMKLKRIYLVDLDKRKHEKHRPVYVKSKVSPSDVGDMLKWFSTELHKSLRLK